MPDRRALLPRLLVVALLALLVGVAWLTRQPEAPVFVAAERLPVAGAWVARLRALYLPPPESSAPAAEIEVVTLPADVADLVREHVWIEPGTRILERPDAEAGELVVADAYARLPVVERRGRWHRVSLGGRLGWARLPERPSSGPPLGSASEPPGPVAALSADPERLAMAREILGKGAVTGWIGSYRLLAESSGTALADFLELVVRGHRAAYRARYGLEPIGRPLETVVLFRDADDYGAYQAADGIAGFLSSGHTAGGVVATFVEGRTRREVAATVIHELTHLLNRRAIGPALPSWLDEGLADDLAQSAIDELGRLRPGTLGGESVRHDDRIEWTGGLAAAVQLRRALDRGALPPLAEVVALDWRDFVSAGRNQTHYALCSFLVRYLLRPESPRTAIGFRTFLADVASGREATGERLLERLETDWPTLEAAFRPWLAAQVPEGWLAAAESARSAG